jgi:hypothetical protein
MIKNSIKYYKLLDLVILLFSYSSIRLCKSHHDKREANEGSWILQGTKSLQHPREEEYTHLITYICW